MLPQHNRPKIRGLNGANDEFVMLAAVQNLRKLAKYCSQRPPRGGVTARAAWEMEPKG